MTVESEEIGAVTVSTGAVTVEKSFTDDEFPVPTVVFDIRSTATEPVEIRLTDDVPESVEMGAIGFHPDYDGDDWTAFRDRRVRYETTIDPEGSVRTVYGVRADEDVRPEAFLGEPRLELHEEGTTQGDDVPVHEPNGSVDEALAPDGPVTEVGVPDVDEAAANVGPSATPEPAALAAALAEAVRADAVADEDLETLRDAIGTGESVPTSVQVRIDRLQTQVQDLAAYTDALEMFLDEEGEGPEAVAGFRADLDEVSAEVAELTAAVESLDERVVDVESTADGTAAEVETLSRDLDALDEEVTTVSEDLGGLDEEVETLSDDVGELDEEVETLSGDVEALDEEVTTVSEDLDALDEEVTAVSEDLEETREAAEGLREEIEDRLEELSDRVDDVDGETDELVEKIEQLNEFRERLNSAFGPGPGSDESSGE
jgi:peptidoglycan hydrolase CwlO-like protein